MLMPFTMPAMLPTIDMRLVYDGLRQGNLRDAQSCGRRGSDGTADYVPFDLTTVQCSADAPREATSWDAPAPDAVVAGPPDAVAGPPDAVAGPLAAVAEPPGVAVAESPGAVVAEQPGAVVAEQPGAVVAGPPGAVVAVLPDAVVVAALLDAVAVAVPPVAVVAEPLDRDSADSGSADSDSPGPGSADSGWAGCGGVWRPVLAELNSDAFAPRCAVALPTDCAPAPPRGLSHCDLPQAAERRPCWLGGHGLRWQTAPGWCWRRAHSGPVPASEEHVVHDEPPVPRVWRAPAVRPARR